MSTQILVILVTLVSTIIALPVNDTIITEELIFQQSNASDSYAVAPGQSRIITHYLGPYGQVAGTGSFSDCSANYQAYGVITKVNIWAGTVIDRIQLQYGSFSGPARGGSGGSLSSMWLAPGEYITTAFGRIRNNWYLVSLGFRTNKGRVFGQFGAETGASYTYFNSQAPAGKRLMCIAGKYFNYGGYQVVGSLTFGWGA